MNIFEDLIEELREENLIEQAIPKVSKPKIESKQSGDDAAKIEIPATKQFVPAAEEAIERKDAPEIVADDSPNRLADDVETPDNSVNEADIYRQRAIEEVTFLQMVESAFAGVEREQMKIVPKPFDDLGVKKVLHSFLQAAADANSDKHARAQFQLLQETQNWHSSLALRDKRILTANLRRYCETSRPPLSSPALIALARFYRNSPYSEQVRSKFDLVITRLFSKESGSRRELVFDRDELVVHLKELYADWSSIPLYATETDDAEILSLIEKFKSLAKEAEDANSFDELVQTDYFNRLHHFKDSTNENFYAPLVTATAIECNVSVGNRYVELVQREKETGGSANLENKYGVLNDYSISEATSKTLSLVELLNQKKPATLIETPKPVVKTEPKAAKPAPAVEAKSEPPVRVEAAPPAESASYKWIAIATIGAILIALAIYLAAQSGPDETQEKNAAAPKIQVSNPLFKEHLREATIQSGTLNGVVLPEWSKSSDEKKREALKQMLKLGDQHGYTKVHLADEKGKPAGSAENGDVSLN